MSGTGENAGNSVHYSIIDIKQILSETLEKSVEWLGVGEGIVIKIISFIA